MPPLTLAHTNAEFDDGTAVPFLGSMVFPGTFWLLHPCYWDRNSEKAVSALSGEIREVETDNPLPLICALDAIGYKKMQKTLQLLWEGEDIYSSRNPLSSGWWIFYTPFSQMIGIAMVDECTDDHPTWISYIQCGMRAEVPEEGENLLDRISVSNYHSYDSNLKMIAGYKTIPEEHLYITRLEDHLSRKEMESLFEILLVKKDGEEGKWSERRTLTSDSYNLSQQMLLPYLGLDSCDTGLFFVY